MNEEASMIISILIGIWLTMIYFITNSLSQVEELIGGMFILTIMMCYLFSLKEKENEN